MDRRALGGVFASVAVALLLLGACGSDPECKKAAECPTVVCPDGIKHQACNDGSCFAAEDCGPQTSGGW